MEWSSCRADATSTTVRWAWEDGRLIVDHPGPTGFRCVTVVPNAKAHVVDTDLTIDAPIHCTVCGVRARIDKGEWVVLR